MIRTRLHELESSGFDDPLLKEMYSAHKYFIDEGVISILSREDVSLSISAMVQADVARLPFAPLLIEFFAPCINEVNKVGRLHACVLLDEKVGAIRARNLVTYMGLDEKLIARVAFKDTLITFDKGQIVIACAGDQLDGDVITIGIMCALLMLNVKGIEKEIIEPVKLNAARAKKGKSLVPAHTVIRIGTIYDRAGRGYRYDGNPGTGRHVRVHMRRGHARHQACGEGQQDRKWVYIPPVLVNYRDGDSLPVVEQVIRV